MTTSLQPRWIDTSHDLAAACERAARAGAIAIDTEADSFHSYFHKLCLIQMSFAGEHVVIDPLALGRDAFAPFVALLGELAVRKFMHGADYDLRVLDRDLGARVVGVRDTQIAAQLLGEKQTGLATLVLREVGFELDKALQRADWAQRPLPAEMLAYAAGDTAYLETIAGKLATRLNELGRLSWWDEECAALESIRWEPPTPDPLAFERLPGARKLRGEARDRLCALYLRRESIAAGQDAAPFRVLHGAALVALAAEPPADLEAMAKVHGVGKSTVRKHGATLLRLLASPPAAPPRAEGKRFVVDRERDARVRVARAARDEVATALAIDGGVLAPRAALESVVDRLPVSDAGFVECLGRRWRAAVLAPHLLPRVASWRAGEKAADAQSH